MKIKNKKTKNEVDKKEINVKEENPMKIIDSIVFDSFKKLTSDIDENRVNAGLQLLQHLSKNQEIEKQNKEIEYALKRLIRGVGASTTQSRAGFFTTLVGFLQTKSSVTIDTTLETAKKQLHVGSNIANKEDADALVGQILTCGALLRSNKITEATQKNLVKIIEILIAASKHKTYHHSLAYSFIVELLQKVNEEQFIEAIWPTLQSELHKPWPKQNINTIHCLIVAQEKFPNIITSKYLKKNFGGTEIVHSENYKNILRIFWENTKVTVLFQPGFECFGKYIANCKNLIDFWTNDVNKFMDKKNITKLGEMQTIKILTNILLTCNPNNTIISSLLTDNFMKMMITSLKTIKTNTLNDGTLKVFYDDFFEALLICCNKLNENDDKNSDGGEKCTIIKKLILYPGILNIEKFTTNRIIHQLIGSLKENGIKNLFNIYKNIFLNKLEKNPNDEIDQWLNVERQNAGYMLQTLISHKSVQLCYDWRFDQLKFFMSLGLFNTNCNLEIIEKNDNEIEWITKDYCEQMKNIFYTSLQSKMPRLQEEKSILINLIEICNDILQRKHYAKFLRNKIDEQIIKAWQEMYKEIMIVTKKKNQSKTNDDKLQLVFHVLLLHMGLQLFREPEMAEAAILDLEKCMKKTKKNNQTIDQDEPEWIEVVVDLFLHLLSQNTSSLRNIVNSVFPHLCGSLTLTAVNQILSVLDMKDGFNPLSETMDNDETEEINGIDDKNDDSDGEDSNNEKLEKNSDDGESSNDDDDDDDDDEEIIDEGEEEESVTETDKLRNAISIALGSIGNRDTDQESVDLNDMNDEDGEKLDKALSEAFKAMRKTSDTTKRSKVYRIKTTTTMHFRIRVLELIEIYIHHNPNLLVLLEILINLFNMIEFCTENDMFPLANKIDKVLNKLTTLRQFTNTNDVNEENICNYLRLIIEKKINSSSFEAHNKIRSKCCHFLIIAAKQCENSNNELTKIYQTLNEYLTDFIKSRNPTVNITLLTDIFKMRWQGIWNLSIELIQNGLIETTRTYRRIQIIELLENLYKNHELIRQNLKLSIKSFKLIENHFNKHLKFLINLNSISLREFTTILNLLITINRCYNKLKLEMNLNKNELCELIQEMRKKIKLESTQNYSRFCNIFGLKIIKNSNVIQRLPTEKLIANGKSDILMLENVVETNVNSDKNKRKNMKKFNKIENIKDEETNDEETKKRKQLIDNNYRKEKKLKKEERLKISSKGLNGGFSFNGVQTDAVISDGSENDDDDDDDEDVEDDDQHDESSDDCSQNNNSN